MFSRFKISGNLCMKGPAVGPICDLKIKSSSCIHSRGAKIAPTRIPTSSHTTTLSWEEGFRQVLAIGPEESWTA